MINKINFSKLSLKKIKEYFKSTLSNNFSNFIMTTNRFLFHIDKNTRN